MKRPCAPLAVAYAVGILLGHWFPVPLVWAFAVAMAVVAAAWWRVGKEGVWVGLTLVALGWVNLTWRRAELSPLDLRRVAPADAELVTVHGRLTSTPSLRLSERENRTNRHTLAFLAVDALRRDGHWEPARGRVVVRTPGEAGVGLWNGVEVEVYGILRMPPPAVTDGLFDYRQYLEWEGIYRELVCRNGQDWRVIEAEGSNRTARKPWADRFQAWAQAVMGRGLAEEDESLRLLWAMTLGWKTALTDEVAEPFMRSGTMHIFAISGLHVALIAGILVAVLRVLQIPRAACGFLVVPALWLYTAATGWQASAIRSSLMMSLVVLGWGLRRPSDLLNSLAVAALVLLLWEPRQLFQASFQLSFFVVLALALAEPLSRKIEGICLRPEPFLPARLRPRWREQVAPGLHYGLRGLLTSTAAWLGSAPLVAHYFHLVTPVSLLANLVVVPLSSFALMSSLGSLACGDWLPAVGVLFNHSGWFWMTLMVESSEYAAALPGGAWFVPAPGPAVFIGYYAFLIVGLSGWLHTHARRVGSAVALAFALTAWGVAHARQRSESTLTVLPLRGGSAIWVDAPETAMDALVDTGDADAFRGIVEPLLESRGVNRLPRLVLTHGDIRHVGGALRVLERWPVDRVTMSPLRFRSPVYRRLLDQLGGGRIPVERVSTGGRAGGWRVLHPTAGAAPSLADDGALALQGLLGGVRILLLSDLGPVGQQALCQHGAQLRADVVIAGLPVRGEPLTEELLTLIQPGLVYLADADPASPGRASDELKTRLQNRLLTLWCASEVGAMSLRARGGKLTATTRAGDAWVYSGDPLGVEP